MAKKAKNWKEILKTPILLRIIQIIDEREDGSVPKFILRTGIDKGTYYICLERDSAPKIDTLVKIKNAYGISLDWLVCGDGEVRELGVKISPEPTLESATKNAKLEGRIEELEKKVQEYKDLSCKLLDKLPSKTLNKKREN